MARLPRTPRRLRDEILAILERSWADPAWFIEHVLCVVLRAWQRKACDEIRYQLLVHGDPRIRVVIRSCHGAGKTFFAAALLLWWMATRQGSRGLTTAPTWSGVEYLLWPEVGKLWEGSVLGRLGWGRLLQTRLTLERGWFATGAASDRPANLEGHHSKYAAGRFMDEAKAIPRGIFDATEGMLDAPEILDCWITTPSIDYGRFWERDIRDRKRPLRVIRIKVDIDDLIADGVEGKAVWKQERIEEWGEESDEYRSRALALYVSGLARALFPGSFLDRACGLGPDPVTWDLLEENVPLAWGIGQDVAGSTEGDQNAKVVGCTDGMRVQFVTVEAWRERNTMRTWERLVETSRGLDCCASGVDAGGIGKGVYDRMVDTEDMDVREWQSGFSANDTKRYVNRKAEVAFRLRAKFEKGLVRLPKPRKAWNDPSDLLRTQLAGYLYDMTSTNRKHVIDPDESPDCGDAALICSDVLEGLIPDGGGSLISAVKTNPFSHSSRVLPVA